MRLRHCVRMLAAVLAVAAVAAPGAQAAVDNYEPPSTPLHSVSLHRSASATNWGLIWIGTASAVVVMTAGATGLRRLHRRHASVGDVGAASSS
ncbi:MAG TPA: hypothetical protein VFN87_19230 [Solirubrobacteraceae bacterium]|nr:hypothetical protein [Solirubrobacteraceae bacterium]